MDKSEIKHLLNATELVCALENYITRIESYQNNYSSGFWFFSEARGINRHGNYLLAIALRDALQNGDNIATVFSNVDTKRDTIMHQYNLNVPSSWVKGIYSSDLKKVIEMAQHLIPENQAKTEIIPPKPPQLD